MNLGTTNIKDNQHLSPSLAKMENSSNVKPISVELKGHFLRLYQLALSDGEFSSEELQMLYAFAHERSISKSQLDRILLEPVGPIAVPQNTKSKVEYLYDFALMIWADQKVTEDEETMLKKYARKFGFLPENIDPLCDELLQAAQKNTSKADILKELEQ